MRPGKRAGRRLPGGAVIVLAAAAALLASSYLNLAADLTASGRNSLSPASVALLGQLTSPLSFTVYVREDRALGEAIRQMVDRYRRVKPDIAFAIVDPTLAVTADRAKGVQHEGELELEYEGRKESLRTISEDAISNAIQRLARPPERIVAYLTGRGERDPLDASRRGLKAFAERLGQLGFRLIPLRLMELAAIPAEIAYLMILPATVAPGAAESAAVMRFVTEGGNVLWLTDSDGVPAFDAIAATLGVEMLRGVLVNPASEVAGKKAPEFMVVSQFGTHPVTETLTEYALFPTAMGFTWRKAADWKLTGLAASGLRSWLETGALDRPVRFEAEHDHPGPVDIALALERAAPGARGSDDPPGAAEASAPRADAVALAKAAQRLILVGDADFLSNAYFGFAGNSGLALRMSDWLAGDDALINIPAKRAVDLAYAPGPYARAAIALAAPLALPLLYLLIATACWRQRR